MKNKKKFAVIEFLAYWLLGCVYIGLLPYLSGLGAKEQRWLWLAIAGVICLLAFQIHHIQKVIRQERMIELPFENENATG